MTALQRMLLSAGLAPLVLLALVAALNLRQHVSLRVLIWSTPALPVGAWMAIAAAGGCSLSCVAGLALQQQVRPLQREVHRRADAGRGAGDWAEPPWPEPEQRGAAAWPERDLHDPAPTVAVPYRVIQRGTRAASANRSAPEATAATQAADDWSTGPTDDW